MFLQLKDTKHMRWDFYFVDWVMPQGWNFGALGVNFFFKRGHEAYQTDADDEHNKMQVTVLS